MPPDSESSRNVSMPAYMDQIVNMFGEEKHDIAKYLCADRVQKLVLPDLYCGEFPLQYSREMEVFVWAAFSVLIAVALIGNAIVMYIIIRFRTMRKSFNYFLFNMALADFLMALMNTGTTWTFNFYYDWGYGNFCPLNHFFGIAPTCVSAFTMMCAAHSRCTAIVNPLGKRAMSKNRARLLIIIIWSLAIVFSLPNVIQARVEAHYYFSYKSNSLTKRNLCLVDSKYKFAYDNFLFIAQYAVPLLVLTTTYARIWRALRNVDFPTAVRINVPHNHSKDKRKAVKMLGLVVIIFMVCWLPYQLYHMFTEYFTTDPLVGTYSYLFIYWLAMSACMYNPIIYYVFNARFRTGFIYIFKWLPGVHFTQQHQQEIFPDLLRMLM